MSFEAAREVQALVILHELAHAMLRTADLAAASGVPWWAASERLDMTEIIFSVYGG